LGGRVKHKKKGEREKFKTYLSENIIEGEVDWSWEVELRKKRGSNIKKRWIHVAIISTIFVKTLLFYIYDLRCFMGKTGSY
jgi:hypothetical protein